MAIATYTDLLAEVASYLRRSDLTSFIPDFVRLAEVELGAELRVRQMETALSLTTTAQTETTALPSDYLQMRVVYLTVGTRKVEVEYVTPANLRRLYPSTQRYSSPKRYGIEANNIVWGPVPDLAYTVSGIYYASLPALASNSTNWLLTNFPNAYLYRTLKQAAPFIGNDARMAMWEQMGGQIINKIMMADQRDRHPGVLQMATDTGNP